MSWHTEPLTGFDLETTGVNVETARIVTCAVVDYKHGDTVETLPDRSQMWLANPGMPIPAEASAVHGVSTEQARTNGRPAADVANEIADSLAASLSSGIPVVAMNARYDFTVLDRELRRHQLPTLQQRLGTDVSPGPVIDPFILDKQADKYRRGSRKLEALAAHYGLTLVDAHTADADAFAGLQVAVAIGEKYEQLHVHAEQLHVWQIQWATQQAAGFQQHLRKTDPYVVIDGDWPMVPLTPERKLRTDMATLAERYEAIADMPTTEDAKPRVRQAKQMASDIRTVLTTGKLPGYLAAAAPLGDIQDDEGAAS
jgi:DNA polymerase-3 subunit epsilon